MLFLLMITCDMAWVKPVSNIEKGAQMETVTLCLAAISLNHENHEMFQFISEFNMYNLYGNGKAFMQKKISNRNM